ncbi:hypothetical protein HPB47_002303 [Ixodes persulcatus]|uniref:Uncharacterized protein n=1 Tax=Ixodes persulcatus TaxID=34615 RepID=A0AC60PLZ1_IXOPE|nr:hypothetical protein HPB47_002303 [Ixodes persulcatus]
MADDVEATTSTTTTTTAPAPSADSDGDIVVWRHGEQRPPNWPSGNFRRPYPDIIDPGFAPDYHKRFRVPQVPNSQFGKPLPDFKLVPVNLTEILSEDQSPENAFDKFVQGLRNTQPQQQGPQATRAEVDGTNLDARTLANAGQNRQGSSQRLPEAAREMLQGLGQLGSDVLDRLNVYRNENAFAEFLQNMQQPSASRDIFTNLFRREPSTS